MRQLIRDEGAVSLVEFALIAPLLILLTVGFLDVARAMNAVVVLGSASEEGAHFAALNPTATIPAGQSVPPAIASAARARTAPLSGGSIDVSAEYYDTAGATFRPWPSAGIPTSSPSPTGVVVRVTVSYPWSAVSAVAGTLLSSTGSNTLTSSALMETRR
jgi:Flp pilus assembly protein TadG